MKSFLNQIEDRELILLLYTADELSSPDRAEVDRLLASDEALRRQLQALRASQEMLDRKLAEHDAAHPIPGSRSAAARHFGRAVQQWHIDRLARPQVEHKSPLRFQWWAYPLATAAAITIAFLVWWQTLSPPVQPQSDSVAVNPPTPELRSDPGIDLTGEEPAKYAVALESMEDTSSSSLAEMEREMQAVQSLRETSSPSLQ